MSDLPEIEVTTVVKATPELIGHAFAQMNSDEQARFFTAVADYAEKHFPKGGAGPWWQWNEIGQHMREGECDCVTPEARDVVRFIYEGLGES